MSASSPRPLVAANPANPDVGGRLLGLAPVFDAGVRVLVLGSFPGVASLQAAQYYAHPRNAFWPVMAELLGEAGLPARPYALRLQALLAHGVGLWDAVASCVRVGSLDAAIESAAPSDLPDLLLRLPGLRAIGCNGAVAFREARAILGEPGLPLLKLPSTSPAHAGLGLADKISAWRAALGPHLG
ncbi:MAG: DNA-deoxyinosine glycosylase [Burkholderiales bacterium]|nr:MAG: DNA-deoxyinosine glycosylase [Burkholderiales bacterium]